jgi:hypothetical protein
VVLVLDATEKLASDWSNLPRSYVGGVGDRTRARTRWAARTRREGIEAGDRRSRDATP